MTAAPRPEVLVIAGDPALHEALEDPLARAGIEAASAWDGSSGLRSFYTVHPDLVVLELDLPGVDGHEVLARIKQVSDVPVVAIVAGGDGRRAAGLRAGADACFSGLEEPSMVLAWIGSRLCGDPSRGEDRDAIEDEFVRIDRARHLVTVAGVEVTLTPTEFRLLEAFVENPGLALAHEELLDSGWGDRGHDRDQVKLYVGYLRRKLAVAGVDPVETVRGIGYRYAPRRIGPPEVTSP